MKEPRDILAPLRDFQVIQFINKNNENTTPKLPPPHIRWIGLYMLMPTMLERLLGLVAFIEEQNNAAWTAPLADVSNTLNNAIKKYNPELFVLNYNEALATVTKLIRGSETKLLLAAAEAGNQLAVAQILMVEGIDVNAEDNYGWTALMLAAWNGHEAVVAQLLKASGIDVNAKDKNGMTALMCAGRDGHTAVVAQLLKASGIDVNAKDKNGMTALMCAARDGYTAVVAELLKASGIDVNVKDNNGWTALKWAAWNRHKAVVHALCLKQLLNAPSKEADAALLGLNAEIEEVSSSMTITPLSLHDHLLASLEKLPTQDEKTALLEKALSNNNAFSALMQQEGLQQHIQTELGKLNTPSTPVIFSTAAPTEPRAATNSTCIIG